MTSPEPYAKGAGWKVFCGDALDILPQLPEGVVDAVVTDPPYGLNFMGKEWDQGVPGAPFWEAALRVLKPGGHLLSFGGTRTFHRMGVAIEDAGFEIRDTLSWMYGQGFPKNHNISKAIDKMAGVKGGQGPMKRGGERLARLEDGKRDGGGTWGDESGRDAYTYAPGSTDAQEWEGWGTALKPAWEPIILARKPFKGTVAKNVLEHGTGALNIDATRIGTSKDVPASISKHAARDDGVYEGNRDGSWSNEPGGPGSGHDPNTGRWPANVALDEEAAELVGEPSRFFYVAKASKKERNAGLDHLPKKPSGMVSNTSGQHITRRDGGAPGPAANNHPTVKPVALMQWLVRLVTPPGGVVLDPFAGSGTTGVAALAEGFKFGGIELEQEYADIAVARIAYHEEAA